MQINIKVGNYIISAKDYNSIYKVLKIHPDGVDTEDIETSEKVFIPCSDILLISFSEDKLNECARCGKLIFDAEYCDNCYYDLFGGNS